MDFSMIIGDLKDYRDFNRAEAMNESKLETPGSIHHVQETASRGLSQLLLSRFLLLGLLVEEVQRKRKPVSSLPYRRLWVLLQVQPGQIFGAGIPNTQKMSGAFLPIKLRSSIVSLRSG